MMKYIILLLPFLIILSCKTQQEIITIDDYSFESYLAPGVNRIATNFFADEKELSNIDYKEYMYWTERIYGKQSNEYHQILPDTSVWLSQNHADSLHITYFSSPAFDSHPVVGITLEQAKIYTKWRTDRVAEMILVQAGLIKINPQQNKDNYFTIQRYFEGKYESTIQLKSKFVLPVYSIPSSDEWKEIAGLNSTFKYGLDSLDKHNKKLLHTSNSIFNTKKPFKPNTPSELSQSNQRLYAGMISPVNVGPKNIFGLYHTIGNVAELVDESGIAQGGDWKHQLDETDLKNPDQSNIPNAWTGFRNVCRLVVIEKK